MQESYLFLGAKPTRNQQCQEPLTCAVKLRNTRPAGLNPK